MFDRLYLEMRERCLSLAADFDRIGRADGAESVRRTDPRFQALETALKIILDGDAERARRVQMLLSDTSPPPQRVVGRQ